jgi:hypothetical protein
MEEEGWWLWRRAIEILISKIDATIYNMIII